jgi:aspartyl-tRNA(Asn)/glutamyl-tRNA(Gln) amidotransferase subunit B
MGEAKRARLVRMHLEEDTAKLFHGEGGAGIPAREEADKNVRPTGALLDFSRSGIPLLEIVTEPDFRGGAECISYLEELRTLLRRLGVSAAEMESGNFRCEPNVSVRHKGESTLRTKTELKNLNSFATLRRAVEAEVARQIGMYDKGEDVVQSTMRYDQQLGVTIPMRLKETADDYRYFDDPDIPPLVLDGSMYDEAQLAAANESGFEMRSRLVSQGLAHEHAATIADDEELRRFYELCVADRHDPREVAKWVTGELTRLMREAPLSIEPGELSAVLKQLDEKKLTLMQAREVFEQSYREGRSVAAIVEEKAFGGAHTEDELRSECMEVLADNPKVVDDIRGGKVSAMQVLIGQVMKRTRGSVKPEDARRVLGELLGLEL